MTAASAARRQRRLEAKSVPPTPRPFPGGEKCCPQCKGYRVVIHDTSEVRPLEFYARKIVTCIDCRIAWEPANEAHIWDWSDPCASFSEPCDNCAFRPGSPEQADTEEWKKLITSLRAGAAFHCHKGVPIEPGSEHGFAYPLDEINQPDRRNLRLCRGYLNALGKWWGAAEPDQSNKPSVPGQPGERT